MTDENPQDETIKTGVNLSQDSSPQTRERSAFSPLLQTIRSLSFSQLKHTLAESWRNLKSRPRLYISVLGGIGVLLLLIIGLVTASLLNHRARYAEQARKSASQSLKRLSKVEQDQNFALENLPVPKDMGSNIPLSNEEKINALIQKADTLYGEGQIDEALQIFNNISRASSSVANHNLGVIKMHRHDYMGALESFERAIATKRNTSASAVDAIAAAFYLNNMDLYTRYLKLTMQNLSQMQKQPIYSYVYSLGLYYGGHYFESLSTLTNPSSDFLKASRERLGAKMFLLFGDEEKAIQYLESIADRKDYKALGLLYARRANYPRALDYLRRYSDDYPRDLEAMLATEIIALKVGDLPGASHVLSLLIHGANNDKNKEKILSDTYPLEPTLNTRFFDINTIRRDFWKTNFRGSVGLPVAQILFYYAPFRLVETKKALGTIQEGAFFVDTTGKRDFEKAVTLLQEGKNTSISNQYIIAGLKNLSQSHLRVALRNFQLALQADPNSTVGHYNVGLIYAQLEDFHHASFHFKKSYYLDNHNVLGGIFAVLASRLAYEDPSAFLQQLTRDFQNINLHDSIQKEFLASFIGYLNGVNNDDLTWMSKAHKPLSIYYALNIAYANKAHNKQRLIQSFAALKKRHPDNMLTNIFYEMMLKYHADIKQMLGAYAFLTSKNMDLEELIHGPLLARKMYIYMGFITGLLDYEENQLSTRLSTSQNQDLSIDLMRMLALLSIFQKKYQKAASILNFLIDKMGEKSAEPLVLDALANIALKRFGDAALFLEIAKNMYPGDYDVRYGLGLLYQRVGNLEASLNNFRVIKDTNFHSPYFDFRIKTPTNQEDLP